MKLYFQLCRLAASNRNLLKIYYTLFYKIDEKEAVSQKMNLAQRIALRENIKQQLEKCMEKIRKQHSAPIRKAGFSGCERLARMLQKKNYLQMKIGWRHCRAHERKNVNKYYHFLYSPGISHEMADMLLEQKGKIETFLVEESHYA